MRIAVTIFRAPVVAAFFMVLLATEARACESSVANNPLLNETVVHYCADIVVEPLSVKPTPPPPVVKKAKYKKRCWYTNKRGKRKYRMRYKC